MDEFTRESYWTSNSDPNNVRKIKVKNMSNTHIANVILWIQNRQRDYNLGYPDEILEVFVKEAELRGLRQDFLNRAPYPYDSSSGDPNNPKNWKNSLGKNPKSRTFTPYKNQIEQRLDAI